MTPPTIDQDAVVACADLVRRSGGREFEIGYLRDSDEPEHAEKGAGWYAQARYNNRHVGAALLVADEKDSPDEAADALARRILAGGQCFHCKKPVVLGGNLRTACRWTRQGARWARGCES